MPVALEELQEQVKQGFREHFNAEAEALFSAPGRTEIGGNHTDHQHGHVLAAAVNMDILAAVRPNNTNMVRLWSEGYPLIEVDLNDLESHKDEQFTSAALIRGIAAAMTDKGYDLHNAGFDAYAMSNVPGGSGLSSSAAFEVLIGTIFNDLACDNAFTPVEIAQIGQLAENKYFGKPCGLMDQTASAVGGVVAIDFEDPTKPIVNRLDLDLGRHGYALCIIDSHASHADLTNEYAAITDELKAVSQYFNKEVLRDINEREFYAALPELRKVAGDRAVLRAMHFYADDKRAQKEAEAVQNDDFDTFLALVRESGESSAMYLQNIVPAGSTDEQALMVTLALSDKLLGGRGAIRVHGGGFGGTAQAFVPLDMLDSFKKGIEDVLGEDSCKVLSIRAEGGTRVS